MSKHMIGISGSTIMSDPNQLEELFNHDLPHIEIGEFPNEMEAERFFTLAREYGKSFGIHSPLTREGSKYDLIDEIKMPPQKARVLFEREVFKMAKKGAAYVLVHFPYFKNKVSFFEGDIYDGLRFLNHLQNKYGIRIVCEPKLGPAQSPHNIQYLHDCYASFWQDFDLSICLDIGDYRMAAGDQWEKYITRLLPHIKVVHLHNVEYKEDGYFWVPLHPQFEQNDQHYDMKPCIDLLNQGESKYFIFEHTPHTRPTPEVVSEGIHWVNQLLK
ncbi:sugar phosphate isomerase/epimerase family protein [Halobacillus yeomjeoni]|nr:sugar phosphate isomerase/epimerase [Halobacillus yeomjeoni]